MARLYDVIGNFFSNRLGIKDTSDASKITAFDSSRIATLTSAVIRFTIISMFGSKPSAITTT